MQNADAAVVRFPVSYCTGSVETHAFPTQREYISSFIPPFFHSRAAFHSGIVVVVAAARRGSCLLDAAEWFAALASPVGWDEVNRGVGAVAGRGRRALQRVSRFVET